MDFTTVLRSFMARALRTNSDLARLAGISLHTLEHWTAGRVQRPRFVADVLKLAQALALDAEETTSLLLAAGHPSLAQLRSQAQQTGDSNLNALLAPWQSGSIPAQLPAAALSPLAPRHQLRAPVQDFVGRAAELASARAALLQAAESCSAVAIIGVQGMGGIGKTELVYKVAQHMRHAFPDAQIVLTLRGTSSAPLAPEQALQKVIGAFLPEAKLPNDLFALQSLYRSQLDNKRVLILADDAASAAQVEPLLPPSGSALLVTSRVRFTLPAMTTIDLEQLSPAEAVHLLRTICPRLGEEQAAGLARACGYLPLALRISASLLRSTPALAVADYLIGLTDERQRLAHLRDPEEPQRDVAAILSLSYAQLDNAAQAVFRQLAVFVADFAISLAQAVVRAPQGGDVTTMLYQLQRRNLALYDAERGRWRLHDLVRDLARQRLEAAEEAEAVQWRYARAVVALAEQIQEQYLIGGEQAALALSAFDLERAHIDAARRWAQQHTETPEGNQLLLDAAQATASIGELRYDRMHDSIPLWDGVRVAARRLGDRTKEGRALNNLGDAYACLGEPSTALPYFKQALAIARELGHRPGEVIVLKNLGDAYVALGEPSTALPYLDQALAIAREAGDRRGESLVLYTMGLAHTGMGDTRCAITCCEAALTILQEIGDRRKEGYAVSYLARAQALQGDMEHARATGTRAFAILRAIGDRLGEAECQWLVGLALVQQGEREDGLPLLRAAIAYERKTGHAKAARHAALLARLEAGGELPPELRVPSAHRVIGDG
jgi:tetratricopeptide (TPR) repeat protein